MVKNIIFDVGNVLFSYRWHEMLVEFGLSDEEANIAGEKIFDQDIWIEMDLGNITTKEAIARYGERLPEYKELTEWFISHPEKMPVPRTRVWQQIKQLKEMGYKIYLLSNYSEELFSCHVKDAEFMNYIDGKVVSYELHIAKPDPAIYTALLEKYDLKPEECIFLDDREENTEAAMKLGITSYTVLSEEYVIGVLDTFLVGKP